MKRILLLLLFTLLLSSCSISFEEENQDLRMQTYEASSGYVLNLPYDWIKSEESPEKVEFHDAENQLALSITSELGGVDYYAMREIKDQLTEELARELFSEYEIMEDSGGTKYFRRILKGVDKNGARLVVDIYANQPYVSMRHYLILVASGETYEDNANLIETIISSFSIILSEDEYLQLMDERREAMKNEDLQELDSSE